MLKMLHSWSPCRWVFSCCCFYPYTVVGVPALSGVLAVAGAHLILASLLLMLFLRSRKSDMLHYRYNNYRTDKMFCNRTIGIIDHRINVSIYRTITYQNVQTFSVEPLWKFVNEVHTERSKYINRGKSHKKTKEFPCTELFNAFCAQQDIETE